MNGDARRDHRRRRTGRSCACGGAGACRLERHDRRSRQRRHVGGAARCRRRRLGCSGSTRSVRGAPASCTASARGSCFRSSASAPIEAMDVRGDAGGRIEFSAYELGERALAWIVENRAAPCRTGPGRRRGMPGLDIVAPCSPVSLVWRAGAADLRLDDGRHDIGATDRRRRRRPFVDAGGGRHPGRPARLRPVRRRRQLRRRERAHRGRALQWFLRDGSVLAWLPLPGRRISIVWSAPSELAHRAPGAGRAELAARVADAGGHELGALNAITHGGGVRAFVPETARCHRREARAGRRCGPRRAPACGPGRQSRLRGRRRARARYSARAARSPTRAPRFCSSATPAAVPARCSRCS